MTKETIQLDCGIQECGTPFKVTGEFKDTTFQPGSMGLLSYIMGPDNNNPNIVFQQVVTVRRGKTGKPRINKNMILCPIFKAPGIPLELMFPKGSDTKYFVDIVPDVETTETVLDDTGPINDHYISWLLARSMFVQELDKAVYPPDHQIMSSAGLQGSKQVTVWPRDKVDTLKKFATNIERWHSDGMVDTIADEFGTYDTRISMFNQLRKIEASLIVPRLEYHRKVLGVLKEALNHVSKVVNDKSNKIENTPALNAAIKGYRKAMKARKQMVEASLKHRLGTISTGRKLLKT